MPEQLKRRIDPARLARDELLELRLWMDDVRTEAGIRWWQRRWRAMEIADAVLFELERLRSNRLGRGLIATLVLAAGVGVAALAGGGGSGGSQPAGSQAAAVRPAAPTPAPAPIPAARQATHAAVKPKHRHAVAHHPRRRHHRPAAAPAAIPVAARTPAPVSSPTPRPAAPPPPRRAPAATHHTGGGGQAVQFDNSG